MGNGSRSRLYAALLAGGALAAEATPAAEVPGVGWAGQGADAVLTSIDNNPRPDLILMAYDSPSGANSFRYKVGRNVDSAGVSADWGPPINIPGVGNEAQGAGAAIAALDEDSRPDLVLMAYDNPPGANSFRYRIGFNIDDKGVSTTWSSPVEVGGLGFEGQGADVLVTSLDDERKPDMILMAYDSEPGANSFRYKIGFNLDQSGIAKTWGAPITVPGVGFEGAGAGAALANLDDDPRPELVLMAYDSPPGANSFRFKVGWNLGTDGVAANWDAAATQVPGMGSEGEGAGLTIAALDDDPRPDWLIMAYDSPAGANSFRYSVLPNRGPAQRLRLEIDRLSGLPWPPASVVRGNVTTTMAGLYAQLGIALTTLEDETLENPLPPGTCFQDADLLSLQEARRNKPPEGSEWHVHVLVATCNVDEDTGMAIGRMYDEDSRLGLALFTDEPSEPDGRLRTFAHELGHLLCLRHADGDAWRLGGPAEGTGQTLMNSTSDLASNWGFLWESAALGLAFDRSKARWRPGSGVQFGHCH